MKFTYANVMSTVAMFAAVTTGTGYAAATLAANSVTTKQIKNGQVTLADLHPSIRGRMSSGTTAAPPATGTAPANWTNRGTLNGAVALIQCGESSCPSATTAEALTGLNLTSTTLPSGGKPTGVKFRLTGSVTNEGTGAMVRPSVSIYFADTTPVPESSSYRQLHCTLSDSVGSSIAPGQTVEISEAWCPNFNHVVTGKHMRLKVTAHSATGPSNLRNNLTLEYAAG